MNRDPINNRIFSFKRSGKWFPFDFLFAESAADEFGDFLLDFLLDSREDSREDFDEDSYEGSDEDFEVTFVAAVAAEFHPIYVDCHSPPQICHNWFGRCRRVEFVRVRLESRRHVDHSYFELVPRRPFAVCGIKEFVARFDPNFDDPECNRSAG